MKVVATTRTLNEEKNIDRFISQYSKFCDAVVIVDGGSTDTTIERARLYSKSVVVEFDERVEGKKGLWRNPHGKHINTCIQTAINLKADWIIFDDCDDVPNRTLVENARLIMDTADKPSIFVYRLYVYGYDQYFPEMNEPGKSLWAWKPSEIDIWADEDDPWKHHMTSTPEELHLELEHPEICLHLYCQTPEITDKKLKFYRESGQHPTLTHPLKNNGPLKPLPKHAKL